MEAEWESWLVRYMGIVAKEAPLWEGGIISRQQAMAATNPKVVPRQWLLKRAEDSAMAGDYTEMRRILDLVTNPFEAPSDPGDASSSPPIATLSGKSFC